MEKVVVKKKVKKEDMIMEKEVIHKEEQEVVLKEEVVINEEQEVWVKENE